MKSGTRKSGAQTRAKAVSPRRASEAPGPLQAGDTVWITQSALTEGVRSAEVLKIYPDGRVVCKGDWRAFKPDMDFKRTRAEAIAKAEAMRTAQLTRLRRQVAAIEALNFQGTSA